jgi:glycosyltransferase involved in cell wall biosynthesis
MFRILSRRAVQGLIRFGEREPAITGLISIMSYPTTKIIVTSGKRFSGETKYSYFRQINLALRFLLSFSTKPLRMASALGFLISTLSFVYLIVVAVQKIFFNVGVLGWATIISLITFFSGLQLLFLGILGEYVGKIFMETKNRPRFFIEEKIGNLE